MPEQIEVEAIKDARDWVSNDGQRKLTFYVLDVKRANGDSVEVGHARKQGGQEPQPGETFEAVFEPGKYRQKLKKAPREGGFKGGEKSPQVQAQITRQHSQDMSLRAIAVSGIIGSTTDVFREQIRQWADWFDADVFAAGQRAIEGAGDSPSPGRGPSVTGPEVQNDPAPQLPLAPKDNGPSLKQLEFLEKLAKENGFKDPELGTLMEWANQTLTPGREGTCSSVIDALKSEGVPEAERLNEASQNWAKSRSELPADTEGLGQVTDSDLPF